jgi:hypothetical protein
MREKAGADMLASVRDLDDVILLCEDLNRMRVFYHETMGSCEDAPSAVPDAGVHL